MLVLLHSSTEKKSSFRISKVEQTLQRVLLEHQRAAFRSPCVCAWECQRFNYCSSLRINTHIFTFLSICPIAQQISGRLPCCLPDDITKSGIREKFFLHFKQNHSSHTARTWWIHAGCETFLITCTNRQHVQTWKLIKLLQRGRSSLFPKGLWEIFICFPAPLNRCIIYEVKHPQNLVEMLVGCWDTRPGESIICQFMEECSL